jgi:glycosidase
MPASNPYTPAPYIKIRHPQWVKNAVIYQINTRQFTPEGTFRAAEGHLPRLKDLGVDILWLMPIHKIGKVNRKGTLGSPYSVKDYYSVNPEFGTLDDLVHFVNLSHECGFHVILDWVANHTAWDNPLIDKHPEWYLRDWKGDFRPTPWCNWGDIIDLDYRQPALRQYMTEAMKYWVSEVDVDGFRCDVAGFVPTDFWNQVRKELETVKPVFMLAEWESRDLHAEAFDMTYAWSWYDPVQRITMGKANLYSLFDYYSWNEKAYPVDALRMTFVSNHDKNAWDGTEYEMFGDGLEAAIVLLFVGEGMPLIYNGQEAGNNRRLAFFEKDPIEWREHPMNGLYKKLIALKKGCTSLWNGSWGDRMVRINNNFPEKVLSFVRQNDQNKVFSVINFSDQQQLVSFGESLCHGMYIEAFSMEPVNIDAETQLQVEPWGYRVYIQEST